MLKSMNRIVKFVLERNTVKAKWRIIPLTYDKWKRLQTDKIALDEFAWKLENQIKKIMDQEKTKGFLRENEEMERRIDEGFQMEKEIGNEYRGVLTLEQNLNSISTIIIMRGAKSLKHLKRWRGKLSFYYKLRKKNKDTDFIILLNWSIISGDSKREKLKTAVHETLHFIEYLKKTRTNFESIENESDRIVDEFLFSNNQRLYL